MKVEPNVFVVRLYTSSGLGGTAIFSRLEGAKQLVARLNEHKKVISLAFPARLLNVLPVS